MRPNAHAGYRRRVLDVWAIELDGFFVAPTAQLDEIELDRVARLDVNLRGRFVAAHVATRVILASYLGIEPDRLEISRAPCRICARPHGRPFLTHQKLDFNLSRSEGWALLAVARQRVGIDLEWRHRRLNVDRLAAETMEPDEYQAFRRLPATHRHDAFFVNWTCKESVVKADGIGLCAPLSRVLIDDDQTRARLLRADGGEDRYLLAPVKLADPAYVATLATTQPIPAVRQLRWPADLDAATRPLVAGRGCVSPGPVSAPARLPYVPRHGR